MWLARCLIVIASATLLAQVPFVNQPLVPTSVKPGGNGFTLTVSGTGFSRRAGVEWNGSQRVTEFISRSRLKAIISAADVAKAGTASVRVVNPGGIASSVVFFTIRRPSSSFTFTQKPVFPNCVGVAVGDFNNDGLLADFLAQNKCGTSIPPHGRCTVNVTFEPTQKGQRSANLYNYDDGGGSPQNVTLSGNGT